MPDDRREIDKDSHKIDIMFSPSNGELGANGDGEISDNDIHLCHGNDKDEHIKTVLWQSGTLATWPAIDLNQLIQQTITTCTNTLNGKQKIKTTVRKQTDSVDSNSVVIYPRFDTLLSGSKEIIL